MTKSRKNDADKYLWNQSIFLNKGINYFIIHVPTILNWITSDVWFPVDRRQMQLEIWHSPHLLPSFLVPEDRRGHRDLSLSPNQSPGPGTHTGHITWKINFNSSASGLKNLKVPFITERERERIYHIYNIYW